MKRLLLILILIPGIAFGTYTEFYCQSGGSNLNACSTTNNTAAYTSTSGNWNGSTTFTVQDGTNASLSVNVGDWASVYVDGASVGVFIGRVTAVQNAINGTITISATAKAGSAPSSGTGTRSIKVGGACQGPNGASGYPVSLATLGALQDASSHPARVNLKNNQTYSISSTISMGTPTKFVVVQGHTGSPGDGGRATIDTSTNGITALAIGAQTGVIDFIFSTTTTTNTFDLVTVGEGSFVFRSVAHGARGFGFVFSGIGSLGMELEAYDCNKANTASIGGFQIGRGVLLYRCYSHDNTTANASGFVFNDHGFLLNSISDTNTLHGVFFANNQNGGVFLIGNSDHYNNSGDNIDLSSSLAASSFVYAENTNLTKATGAGINNATTSGVAGLTFNIGYGAGTQANGSADTLGNITQSGNITYGSNLSPYFAPTTGDFRISLTAARGAGRAVFTETDGTNTGTVGYPDIGAAQHQDTCDNLGPCQTSGASAH